jgi:hypothetical protein
LTITLPSTPQGLLLVIGSIFLSIAILGGGFEISAIKIPPVGNYPRIFAFFTGLIFIVIAVGVPNFLTQGEKTSQKLEVTSEKPEKTFPKPELGDYRLDYCFTWATDCGPHPATAWCKAQGFTEAVSFEGPEPVGVQGKPTTRLIGENKLCAESFCGSFSSITCR